MMKLAIIDYGEDLEIIVNIIQSFASFTYECFKNTSEFYLKKDEFDAIVMEIDIEEDNGLLLAKKLREAHWVKPVIFVTKYIEFAYESFQVQPFRFVRKKHLEYELSEALTALLQEKKKHKKEVVIYIHQSKTLIDVQHVLFFERIDHHVFMYIESKKEIQLSCTLTDIINQSIDCFIRINKSVIVNLYKVKSIDKDMVVLQDHRKIEISRRRKQEVKQKYEQLITQE